MTWYNTVVLSFSSNEFDDEDDPHVLYGNCQPVRKIDAWLKRRGYQPMANLAELGSLCSNVALFGGCYDGLDVDAFCKYVQKLKWQSVEDVRVFFWGDNDDKHTTIEFPLKT